MKCAPNLVLIGFMASGKSTIGLDCARRLRYHFRDSDALVVRRAGKPISQIFEEDGEAAFRKMEAEAIRDLSRTRRTVLSTGGGSVLNTASVAFMRRSGIVILLWASPDAILNRVGPRKSRPLLTDARDPRERIHFMLAEREPYYRAAAHAVVETTEMTRSEAVEHVLAIYSERCGHIAHGPSAAGGLL